MACIFCDCVGEVIGILEKHTTHDLASSQVYYYHWPPSTGVDIIEPTLENGLKKRSSIDLFQVRSLSQKRLVQKVGAIDMDILKACKVALDVVLE